MDSTFRATVMQISQSGIGLKILTPMMRTVANKTFRNIILDDLCGLICLQKKKKQNLIVGFFIQIHTEYPKKFALIEQD